MVVGRLCWPVLGRSLGSFRGTGAEAVAIDEGSDNAAKAIDVVQAH